MTPSSQIELPFWGRGTLREALTAYYVHQCEDIAEATMGDYAERMRWLLLVLGDERQIDTIDWALLDKVKRDYGPKGKGLMHVTLRKRLVFLRAALRFAVARKILRADQVFDMAMLRLQPDGKRGGPVHTPTQHEAFREHLPERMRLFADVGFWTGHHSYDLFRTQKWMVDPDRELPDESGKPFAVGAYYRRNHKVRRCRPVWLPMAPEFRAVMVRWYAQHHQVDPTDFLTGRLWALCKTFAVACDRAQVPRISPKGLRRSFSSNLLGRGVDAEYVRHALGQTAPPSAAGQPAQRATILHEHYGEMTPALMRRAFEILRAS